MLTIISFSFGVKSPGEIMYDTNHIRCFTEHFLGSWEDLGSQSSPWYGGIVMHGINIIQNVTRKSEVRQDNGFFIGHPEKRSEINV